ncbi:MAG: hypothetical protein P1P69_06225 [Methanosarcinaceae archaeon]|nr:hypothetical protein [Methanosarcinaceae archaeon]MCL7411902.1 hypothetical protein [Methanosarcinaceae archaeon]MDF1534083.1 hypothetical protein [Methanosarcinaceae archaeon]
MARILELGDLKTKEEREEIEKELEGLYDLIIPPGTPSGIIYDLVEEFNLEPVDRKMNVNIVESDEREVLCLRGPLETVQAAEQFLYDELDAWISENE